MIIGISGNKISENWELKSFHIDFKETTSESSEQIREDIVNSLA